MGKPSRDRSDDDELASSPAATDSAASLFDPMRLASAASRAGDAASTAKYLFESRFVDGAVSRIGQEFNHADAEDSVAEAVADVCLAIRSGKKVREPAAYVWVAARRRAIDKAMENRPVQFEEDEEVDGTDDDGPGRAAGTDGPARRSWREAEEERRDDLRRKGMAVARTLLPQLGPRVKEVMTYILDAIDAGYAHVPHEQIAEDLGLTADTVRVVTHRGFAALKRLARQLGLHDEAGVGAVIEDISLTADGPEDDEE
ncbi:MAG: hypothetical protein HMLKMBBP_00096 [Planctomycetes bacterium]|nr:hypothetical protein [Planctomycetota bacterium]